MRDQPAVLSIKLMAREAERRLEDAEFLASRFPSESDSGYLLRLLAFEILLKTTLRVHGGRPAQSHSYAQLFESLTSTVKERVLAAASERMSDSADYSNLQEVLVAFGKNFVALRYPYEKYEHMTEADYQARGQAWIDSGAPLSGADFVYHPQELYGLVHALRGEVQGWLKQVDP